MTDNGSSIWEQEAKKGGDGGGDFEVCPPGNFPANIVALFDVGTHTGDYKGKETVNRKFVVVFESQKKTAKGEHFLFAKLYTWSMVDTSNWYKVVSALTGRKFAEGEKFDPRSLLGMPCMVMVTNSVVTKDGKEKTYHQIENVAQFPEGFPFPTEFRAPLAWSISEKTPLPPTSWVPMVYGQSIEALAKESKEFAENGLAQAEVKRIAAEAGIAATDDIPF